jgi:RNA polymerase sigma-70 factor (ECF subfamily)
MDPAAPGVADIESLRLVARFQRGDATAFDGLYRRHFASIYNYARMATSSADHAEDVAQQVFFRAARALPRYRIQPEVPFRAWLLTITRREVLRVLQGHAAVEPRDPEEIAAMTEVTGEDRWAAKWLTLPGIAELVDELPRRQQQVLMLRYALGMSVRETASVIGASEDAVNSLRRRGARLRADADGPEPDDDVDSTQALARADAPRVSALARPRPEFAPRPTVFPPGRVLSGSGTRASMVSKPAGSGAQVL